MILLNLPFWDFFKSLSPYPEYFDNGDYWLHVTLSITILAAIVLIIFGIYSLIYYYRDRSKSTYENLVGQLVDKKYIGEFTSTSSGTAVIPNSDGGVGIGVTSSTSHSPEKFLLFVSADQVYKIQVGMQEFYKKNIGDRIEFKIRIGGLSGEILETELV